MNPQWNLDETSMNSQRILNETSMKPQWILKEFSMTSVIHGETPNKEKIQALPNDKIFPLGCLRH